MPERLARDSAVASHLPRGISLGLRPLGKIDLRGSPAERAFMSGVGRVLDLLLPTEPTGSASKGRVSALWLGPDQWLVTCPPDDTPFFISSLREALGDTHHALTDVSEGLVTFTLAGPSARDVLAKGCPLDLHSRAFTPGSCARSLLAKVDVLLHLHADEPQGFDLHVARSFAQYLWTWLEDAGREYGLQITA
jgi:sarcosine oxidase, subunit gamma